MLALVVVEAPFSELVELLEPVVAAQMIVVDVVVETRRRTSKRMRTRWIGIFGAALRRMTYQMIVVAVVV